MATRRGYGCGRRSGSVCPGYSRRRRRAKGNRSKATLKSRSRSTSVSGARPTWTTSTSSDALTGIVVPDDSRIAKPTMARAYDKVRLRMEIVPEMINTKNAAT